MRRRVYFVYILASKSGTLYTGVTNDLERRMAEHGAGVSPCFTRRYFVHRLVYYETTNDVTTAIAREKQIKSWRRAKRVQLIESTNPGWRDLSSACRTEPTAPSPRQDPSLRSG